MIPLALLYEHPDWFTRLKAVLAKREIPVLDVRMDAGLISDPTAQPPAPVVFNRMSMSAPTRQKAHGLWHAAALIKQWELQGTKVINGSHAFGLDMSKAAQLALIDSLGHKTPATHVVHRASDVGPAARAIGFPVLVKANVGGAGAGIAAYDDEDALAKAISEGTLPTSIDDVLLIQRKVKKRADAITRVETLGGTCLYAVDVVTEGDVFDLCPADVCQADAGPAAPEFSQVELTPEHTGAVERIVQAAGIDVGGVEFMVDDKTGEALFYDINAMSNFVADWQGVLGWDPHEHLADFLMQILGVVHEEA